MSSSSCPPLEREGPGNSPRLRFALVKPVNPDDPAVPDVIADWKKTPGTVGIRIIMTKETNRTPEDLGLDRICRAAVKHDCSWRLKAISGAGTKQNPD